MAEAVGFRPTYSAASWEVVTPASRGMRKKMANVMALTTTSRKTVAIRRRTMNVITVPGAGARPGSRAPAPSPALWWRRQSSSRACGLALDPQHAVVVHAVRLLDEHVGHVRGAVEQIVDHRVVQLGQVGVARRADRGPVHDVVEPAEAVRPVRRPPVDEDAEVVRVRVLGHAREVGAIGGGRV